MALASLYARLTGRSVEASREHWRNGYVEEGTVGIPGFWIIVKTSHPSWVESAYLPNLTILSAHELLHAYQDELSGLPASGVPDDEVPFHGPSWATEGIAEFFAYKASDAGGVLSYDTKRANSVSHAKNMEKPLRGMETWEGGLKGYSYDLPLLGAELLASYAGEDALLRFYMLQRPGTTWQEAFQSAFGMTVEEFYELFEEHRPTPTGPQTVDDYIVWKVGDDVSPSLEAEARETVLAVHDYGVGIGMPRIDRSIAIFLYHNLDSLAAAFEANTGEPTTESWYWPEFSQGKLTIFAGRDWIAVTTSATRYQEWSPDTRKRELAGNLFDVYRRALTGIWQGTPRDAVDPEGPQWLRAGSREYLTYQALRAPGPESCDPTRDRYARISESVDTPLSEAETSEDFWALENSSAHGFLAVELLAEQAGQESIMGYFASLRTGVTWQEAFHAAFGITIEEFYQLFEEHRAAGFLEPGSPESADGKMSAPGPFDHLLQDPSLPPFIRWDVESTVDSRDVEAAIWGVKLMGELQQSLGLPDSEVPINIVIYKDMEKMACNYAIDLGWDLETSRKYWANAVGVSGRGHIYLRASTPQRLRTEPNRLMHTMVHELTHAHFQAGISGLMTDLSGHSRGSTEVPRWLAEGTAMLVTAMLLRENYPENYSQHERSRAEQASNALATGLTLRDSETWPPSEGGRVGMDEAGLNIVACIYNCGYFAAELLASRVGVGKLFDYYLLLEPWMTPGGSEEDFPRPGWRLAFEKAYDMTVEEFYELFEEHRAAGFPDPEGPTPTATPKPEPVVHPSDILDWFADPPDDKHSFAAKSIERIWDRHPDLAAGVARLIWVGDGITWNEEFVLEELSYVVSEDPELVRAVVNQEHRSYLLEVGSGSAERAADYPWLADGMNARELYAIIEIARIAKRNQGFAERVLGYTWLADGITEAEARGLGALSRWALLAPELVDRVLKYAWLDDGITYSEPGHALPPTRIRGTCGSRGGQTGNGLPVAGRRRDVGRSVAHRQT